MLTTKSQFLLKKGDSIWYDWFCYPNGSRYIIKYRGKYFKVVDDGTGNGFYNCGDPIPISEDQAKKILSNYYNAWEKAMKLWGWETLEEYFENNFEEIF